MNLVYRLIGWVCDRLINLDDWAERQHRRNIAAEVERKAQAREAVRYVDRSAEHDNIGKRVTPDEIEPSGLYQDEG